MGIKKKKEKSRVLKKKIKRVLFRQHCCWKLFQFKIRKPDALAVLQMSFGKTPTVLTQILKVKVI